jgi:hypothetical protein
MNKVFIAHRCYLPVRYIYFGPSGICWSNGLHNRLGFPERWRTPTGSVGDLEGENASAVATGFTRVRRVHRPLFHAHQCPATTSELGAHDCAVQFCQAGTPLASMAYFEPVLVAVPMSHSRRQLHVVQSPASLGVCSTPTAHGRHTTTVPQSRIQSRVIFRQHLQPQNFQQFPHSQRHDSISILSVERELLLQAFPWLICSWPIIGSL